MYSNAQFRETDVTELKNFIHQHPFAFMAGCDENGQPVATQVPVFIEERDGRLFLSGHLMRNTDHHKAFEQNQQVLCVFTGAHTYVSATLYTNPHQASTWNYMSVHVKGTLRFLDEEGLVEVLKKTSLHFEHNNTSSATAFHNLPDDYTSKLLKAIVAFEVAVQSIEGVFKLSQNRDPQSYQQIIDHLNHQDADGKAVAEEMQKRQQNLFHS